MAAEVAEKSLAREYVEALLIAVVFATFARTFVVQAFKIPSGSMEQNLLIGDHILVNKFIFGPGTGAGFLHHLLPERAVRRGDIVVFKYPTDPSRDFIKRCMGLPGDVIRIVDKVLYVNGKPVHDESYTYHSESVIYPRSLFFNPNRLRDNYGPYTVPPGRYFCMGDNRDNSNDSRFWGPVPESHIKGRAFLVYWSFDNDSEEVPGQGIWGKLREAGRAVLGFFTQTRWERTFRIVS